MPEIGVLQLSIQDNSKKASQGLDQLAGALGRVKQATSGENGLGLGKIKQELVTFKSSFFGAKGVHTQLMKTVTSVEKFASSLTALSKIKNIINFNTKPIEDLKTAIGDGINLKNNPGGQLEKIRAAVTGDWGDGTAVRVMQGITDAANAFESNGTAGKVKAVADAVKAYNAAVSKMKSNLPVDASQWKGGLTANTAEAIMNGAGRYKLNLQQFGKKSQVKGGEQLAMDIDSMMPAKAIEGVSGEKAASELNSLADSFAKMKEITAGGICITKASNELNKLFETLSNMKKATKGSTNITEIVEELKQIGTMFGKLRKVTDDSTGVTKAANKLKRLGDILSGIKSVASGGIGLAKVATDFTKLGESLENNITESSIEKIRQIAEVLKNLKEASNGASFGNIKISFGGVGSRGGKAAVSAGAAAESPAAVAVEGAFEEVGSTIQRAKVDIDEFNKAFDVSKLPIGALGMMTREFEEGGREADEWAEKVSKAFEVVQRLREYHNQFKTTPLLGSGVPQFPEPDYNWDTTGTALSTMRANGPMWRPDFVMSFPGNGPKLNTDQFKPDWVFSEGMRSPVEGAIEADAKIYDELGRELNEFGRVVEETSQKVSSSGIVDETTRWNQTMEARYRGTPQTLEDIFFGKSVRGMQLRGEGTAVEQNFQINEVARQFGMTVDDVKQKLAELKRQATGAGKPLENTFENATQKLEETATKLDYLNAKLKTARGDLNANYSNYGPDDPRTIKSALDVQDIKSRISKEQQAVVEDVGDAAEESEEKTVSLREAIGKLFSPLDKLGKKFMQIAKYRFLRAVLKQITDGFREGLENLYHYSQGVGTGFAPAMDSAAASLLQMKNAIGAAVAPALQALIPIMQTVVNYFIQGVNYLNQFLSLLKGQQTWTRAVPATTKAFKDVKNSAKGASAAMKDLLADWDELNIIQSESGGGRSGSGALAMSDYIKMFEEVNTFDKSVKDVVGFVRDNMEWLNAIVPVIGAGILAWNFSDAFKTAFVTLRQFLLGGVTLAIGVKFAYDGGFGAGLDGGFSWQSILESALGVGLATFGGAISFGPAGALVGFTLSVVATVVGYFDGLKKLDDLKNWGNVELTPEEIETWATKQFKFDVKSEINVLAGTIKNRSSARAALNEQITTFKKSLMDATVHAGLKIDSDKDSELVTQAIKDAQKAIKNVNDFIQKNNDSIKATLTILPLESSEKENMLENLTIADTTLKEYFTGIGEQMSKYMLEGQRNGWKNGEKEAALELMASQKRILDEADRIYAEQKFQRDSAGTFSGVQYGNDGKITLDSANSVINRQKELLDEYSSTAMEAAEKAKEDMMYLAALAESSAIEAEARGDTEAAEKLRTAAKNYTNEAKSTYDEMVKNVTKKIDESKKAIGEKWIELLKSVYGEDINWGMEVTTSQYDPITNWIDSLWNAPTNGEKWDSYFKRDVRDANMRGGADAVKEYVNQRLLDRFSVSDSTGIIPKILDTMSLDPVDILPPESLEILRNALKDALGEEVFYDMFSDGSLGELYSTKDVFEDAINNSPVQVQQEVEVQPSYSLVSPDGDVDINDLLEGDINRVLNRTRASALGRPINGYTGVAGGGQAAVGQDRASQVQNTSEGVERGNANVVAAINALLTVARQINKKDFSVKFAPNSAWGRHTAKSQDMYNAVTGDG